MERIPTSGDGDAEGDVSEKCGALGSSDSSSFFSLAGRRVPTPLSERECVKKADALVGVLDGLEKGNVAMAVMGDASMEGDKMPTVLAVGLGVGNVPLSKEKEGRMRSTIGTKNAACC